jgi:Domain of unknown function (DUF397)
VRLAQILSISFFFDARKFSQNWNSINSSSTHWAKSSLSTYNGNCLEIGRLEDSGMIGVRDTKDNGRGPVLSFTQAEWDAFLGGAKAGEFDSV